LRVGLGVGQQWIRHRVNAIRAEFDSAAGEVAWRLVLQSDADLLAEVSGKRPPDGD
jgi:hypothetical protein